MWIDFGERGRTLARKANMFENQVSLVSSMTSKKSPNVYKSSPKMISLKNLKIFTLLLNLQMNVVWEIWAN